VSSFNLKPKSKVDLFLSIKFIEKPGIIYTFFYTVNIIFIFLFLVIILKPLLPFPLFLIISGIILSIFYISNQQIFKEIENTNIEEYKGFVIVKKRDKVLGKINFDNNRSKFGQNRKNFIIFALSLFEEMSKSIIVKLIIFPELICITFLTLLTILPFLNTQTKTNPLFHTFNDIILSFFFVFLIILLPFIKINVLNIILKNLVIFIESKSKVELLEIDRKLLQYLCAISKDKKLLFKEFDLIKFLFWK